MKKILIAVALLASLMVPMAHAETSTDDSVISIKKSDLNPGQLAVIQTREAAEQLAQAQKTLDTRIGQYGKWVGIGHELGTAVNESLSAVTTNANTFAQTGVGKWTIFLVIWKVAGHDIAGLVIGVFMMLVAIPIWTYSFYTNCITRRVLIEDSKTTGKKWKIVNDPLDPSITLNGRSKDFEGVGVTAQRGYHLLALVLFIIVDSMMLFG